MTGRLENAAGNFYVNDKPTGAIVGQQPFGAEELLGRTTRRDPMEFDALGIHTDD